VAHPPAEAVSLGIGGIVSTIVAVARNGPPNDFNEQPTTKADFSGSGGPVGEPPGEEVPSVPSDRSDQPGAPEPLDGESEHAAWYRKPVVLIVWAVVVLILIGLIIYGLGELVGGDQGTSPSPSPTTGTTETTTTTTTTPSSTTETSTTPPPPASTTPTTPAYGPGTEPPAQSPPQRHHHLPQLPSVITIPRGPTVTLPFNR
jgi:hypothetical protein